MKTHIKLAFLSFLTLAFLSQMSCSKDESVDEPIKTNSEKIIGTWQIKDGDYKGRMTFEYPGQAVDWFTHDTLAGVSWYQWSLTGNQLSMTLFAEQGDYGEYNEITAGGVRNSVVEITDNQLTINHKGMSYVYTRFAPENIISETDIEGTWQLEDGNYRGVINFEVAESRDNIGTEAFMAAADSGASDFFWDINGDWIFASYEHRHMFGDFESYNEIGANKLIIAKVSTTNNQLTFTVNNQSTTYTKFLSENILSKIDLLGSWKLTDGTLTEIISFQLINSDWGQATHSFIDGALNGAVEACYWTVSGDLFSIEYQGYPYDDFSSYYGISQYDYISTRISHANNQLTFHTHDGDYIYTRMDESEVITNSEIVGTWEITDGSYIGELTFNDNETGSDSFTDGAQSGTASLGCIFNGNMLRLSYGSMTGDYEIYNQIPTDKGVNVSLRLTGNQLTITNDGVDFIYTKKN